MLKRHPEIFNEGGHQWVQHWRSNHCVIFSRDEAGGVQHNFYAYRLAICGNEEFRGELLRKTPSLDDAITACAQVEELA